MGKGGFGKRYTIEQFEEAKERVFYQGESTWEVSKETGIPHTTLLTWKKRDWRVPRYLLSKEGTAMFKHPSSEASELNPEQHSVTASDIVDAFILKLEKANSTIKERERTIVSLQEANRELHSRIVELERESAENKSADRMRDLVIN